jgi:hypothetical protein
MKRNGLAPIVLVILVAVLLAVSGVIWYYDVQRANPVPQPVQNPPCCKSTDYPSSTQVQATGTNTATVAKPPVAIP